MATAFGLAQSGRLDESASPLRFGGRGYDMTVAMEQAFGRISLFAGLTGGNRSLAPLSNDALSSERVTEGSLSVALLRWLGSAGTGAHGFGSGLEFDASGSLTEHAYTDADASRTDFVFVSTTLGPVFAWRGTLGGGLTTVRLSVPVVALVYHPYSGVRDQRPGVDARFVSLSNYRGITGTLTYVTSPARTIGIEYSYRVGVVRYDDYQPLRAVSQILSVGVVRRFGALAQ